MSYQSKNINYFSSESLVSVTAQNIIDIILGMVASNISSVIFLSGGSLTEVYQKMVELLSPDLNLMGLVVALADERDVSHESKDSNEQQIRETGLIDAFEKRGARFVGILPDQDNENDSNAKDEYRNLFLNSDKTVGIFGIGTDGHIAGILPMKDEVTFSNLFLEDNSGYLASYKTRITLTAKGIGRLDKAVLFAKGSSKKQVLEELVFRDKNGKYNQNPSLLLKKNENILEIFTDQLLSKLKE